MTPVGEDEALRARLEAMADALRETFGDRAPEVARRQFEMARDDAATSWEAILACLGN